MWQTLGNHAASWQSHSRILTQRAPSVPASHRCPPVVSPPHRTRACLRCSKPWKRTPNGSGWPPNRSGSLGDLAALKRWQRTDYMIESMPPSERQFTHHHRLLAVWNLGCRKVPHNFTVMILLALWNKMHVLGMTAHGYFSHNCKSPHDSYWLSPIINERRCYHYTKRTVYNAYKMHFNGGRREFVIWLHATGTIEWLIIPERKVTPPRHCSVSQLSYYAGNPSPPSHLHIASCNARIWRHTAHDNDNRSDNPDRKYHWYRLEHTQYGICRLAAITVWNMVSHSNSAEVTIGTVGNIHNSVRHDRVLGVTVCDMVRPRSGGVTQ